MRSADDCLACAKELSRLAELATIPEIAADLLRLAEQRLDVSRMAEWQDTGKFAETIETLLNMGRSTGSSSG
jgi:hypothetical protein